MKEGRITLGRIDESADVFISYSKARPRVTKQLSAFLESEGFSVWWDTELKPNQVFSREIDARLNAAKAVIIIWTPHSIESDWVRAEAEHARRQHKLINTRTPNVKPEDIPKPFNQTHVVEVGDRAAIVAALEELGVVRARTVAPAQRTIAQKRVSRRPIVVAVSVVLSLILAAAAYIMWSRLIPSSIGPPSEPRRAEDISIPKPEDNRGAEDDGAWSVAQKSPTVDTYATYLASYPQGRHADEARTAIATIEKDDAAWNAAQAAGSSQAYDAYTRDNPQGRHIDTARAAIAAIDDADWFTARKADTAQAYDTYVGTHPQGRHIDDARAARVAIQKEEDAYSAAREAKTTQAYETYLREYPQGRYADTARGALQILQKDDADWSMAQAASTIEAYESYVTTHPQDGQHLNDAGAAITEIKDEERDWAAAQKGGTPPAYQAYLQAHANGRHAGEANTALAAIAQDEADWAAARQTDTISAYRTYLREHQRGRHAAEASRTIASKEPRPAPPPAKNAVAEPPAKRSPEPPQKAAKAGGGKCTSIQARCAIAVGGRCNPATGRWDYGGKFGGTNNGGQFDACVSRGGR
jgi:TIR domain